MDSNGKAAEISPFAHPRYLPPELLLKILSHLPAKSIVRCRSVCKQWLSLSYDPHFIKEHQQARAISGGIFLFSRVSLYAGINLCEYEFGCEGDKVVDCSFYLRRGNAATYHISNPVNGLVYITRFGNYQYNCLLNPFSREVVMLPPPPALGRNKYSGSIGLGFDSSTGVYKLVELFSKKYESDHCGCQVLTVGPRPEWKYVGDAPRRLPPHSLPALVGATLHWLGQSNRYVMAFNLTDHKFRLIPTPDAVRELPHGVYMVLLESGGNLCLVNNPFIRHHFITIWRLEDHIWNTQHNIDMSSLESRPFCPYVTGIRPHQILVEVPGRGMFPTTYSYNVHTKSFHKLGSSASLTHLGFITESLVSPRSLIGSISC